MKDHYKGLRLQKTKSVKSVNSVTTNAFSDSNFVKITPHIQKSIYIPLYIRTRQKLSNEWKFELQIENNISINSEYEKQFKYCR